MGILSSNNSYLGVDLGTSSIKVVELANFKGRPRLVTYGFTEKNLTGAGLEGDVIANVKEAAEVLADVCKKANTTSKKVIAALPNFSVFTSVLNLPALSKKELASAISWEAKKIIPIPLEEIILDWKIIEDSGPDKKKKSVKGVGSRGAGGKIFSKQKKSLQILLTGASKRLVGKYIEIFNAAGLSLLSLETESFALTRSLIGNDKSIIMLVDLGAATSSVTVVDRGIPSLSRSIEVGGMMVTQSISNGLNISFDRAEQFKQDLSLDVDGANNTLPQTIEKAFASMLHEIKYTIELYEEQNGKKIEKIILTGGAALLGNLPGYLSKILNINTYIGDPWARVVYPTELKPVLDRLGSRFAISTGLAMRDIE
jgi:type IV pilus assembly protein PilM